MKKKINFKFVINYKSNIVRVSIAIAKFYLKNKKIILIKTKKKVLPKTRALIFDWKKE